MFSSACEYQSAGAGVLGSSGSRAPGMSFQRNVWKVRTFAVSIGCIEYTAMPNWPGKKPNPSASLGPPTEPLLSRSKPDGTPVLLGAMNRYG
jgi:hypothetical protein